MADALNIPNLLTMGRVVAIPFFVWLLDTPTPVRGFWACIVFTLAAITDLLDGYLARKLNVVSVLGKFLDPLADKLIVMAALVWLVQMDRMPAWAVVLLLGREIGVTGLRSVAASEGVIISAGNEGKTKTALQMIGTIALVLGYPFHLSYAGIDLGVVDLVHVGRMLIYLSLLFSFASAAQYVRLFAAAVEAKDKRRESADRAASTSTLPAVSLAFPPVFWSFPPRVSRMRLRFSFLPHFSSSPPWLAALVLGACSNEEKATVRSTQAGNSGNDDCQSGLVCTVLPNAQRDAVLPAGPHDREDVGVRALQHRRR